MQKERKWLSILAIITYALFVNISCIPMKDLQYLNDIDNLPEPVENPRNQKLIMPFDKLSIIVISTDQETAQIINFSDDRENIEGYLVNEYGNINFPFVGDIYIEGLTPTQAGEKIQNAINRIVSNSVVIVKFFNNQVTVLGEVENQGTYTLSEDKINIYEAIALGGGITEFGDRTKIVLLRIEDNKPVYHQLDVSNSQIAYSDFFYILPNDVLIVEPLKRKSRSYQNPIYTNVLSTITALVAILYLTNIFGN